MTNFVLLGIVAAAVTSIFSMTQIEWVRCPKTQICYCSEEIYRAYCIWTDQPLTRIPNLPSYVYSLFLDRNNIPKISNNMFRSIPGNAIMNLSIVDTHLQHIDPDAFKALNHLKN